MKTTSRFFSSVASIVAVGSIACGQSCTPTLVTTFDTPGTAWDVFVVGSTAYVADAASGLQIFDVSNPASPVAIGSYAAAVGAGRVVVQDEIAFVCRGSAGVDLVDVTDPTAPALLSTFPSPFGSSIVSVKVVGTTMYVADWPTHFLVVDIADPTQPSLLGMADTGFSDDVFVEGAFAYVINATFAGSVDVFDVTVPTNPSFYSGFITTQSNGSVTEVAAPYIYNAEWEHGFRVYDMTLPPNSAPVGELSIPQNQFYSSGLSSLGSLVALSSSDDASLREVKIISVADPSDPFIMGQVDVPAPPHRSIISGGFVFVCLGDAGVSIIDISTCQQACYADCDESGALTIFDYICFGNAYAGNEPYADCDNSGSLNVFDYICYGNAYAAGCP